MVRLLQSLLMAPGPFYYYPWKAPINALAGDDYATGYKHFIAGHRHAVNLSLHCACLFIQVFGNFALLNAIDAAYVPQPVAGVRILSAVSAATWAGYLLLFSGGCPAVPRVASIAVLALAYLTAPLITHGNMDRFAAGIFTLALVISNYFLTKKPIAAKGVLRLAVAMAAWGTLWPFIESAFVKNVLGGALAPSQTHAVMGGVAAYLAGLGLMKNPLSLVVVTGMIVARLASAATGGNSVLFFWSYAFAGSFFQGLTHRTVQEEATMLALERESEEKKLRFEWSHVTFFPTLLLHACWNAVTRASGSKWRVERS
jgi:hypothetical protein